MSTYLWSLRMYYVRIVCLNVDWNLLLYFFALCSCYMIPNVSDNARRNRQLTESNSASFG